MSETREAFQGAVVDASSLLAFLNREEGADRVEAALAEGAVMVAVALAEVVAHLAQHGVPVGRIQRAVEGLDLQVEPFDAGLAFLSGRLSADMQAKGMSGRGSACLALGLRDGRTVLTADPAWSDLGSIGAPRIERIR